MASCLKEPARMSHVAIARSSAIISALAAIFLAIATVQPATAQDSSQQSDDRSDSSSLAVAKSGMPDEFGVLYHDPRAFPGYNLITANDNTTYLFDNEGRVVHSWSSETENYGRLSARQRPFVSQGLRGRRAPAFRGPGKHGRFQELDWDGNVLWDFEYISEKRQPHHDAIKLPNGNVLTIGWEMIEEEEAVAQGVRPEAVKESHVQPDCLVEIKPTGLNTGEVVWEWRSWDHLIQDYDRHKPNYGKVSDHPERYDANFGVNGRSTRGSRLDARQRRRVQPGLGSDRDEQSQF